MYNSRILVVFAYEGEGLFVYPLGVRPVVTYEYMTIKRRGAVVINSFTLWQCLLAERMTSLWHPALLYNSLCLLKCLIYFLCA